MALQKQVELENGIILNYHRIVSINKITNNITIIEVASYINEEKRKDELNILNESQNIKEAIPMNIFINTMFFNKEYNENDTIEEMYKYLKTTEIFKDSVDV